MHLERLDYGEFALWGFEAKVQEIFGRRHFLGIVCHKGERRAPTAARMLIAAGYPVANNLNHPTINYDDLLRVKFTVTDDGLLVPGKTDVPFGNLLVFHDGSSDEEKALKRIKELLEVEARGALDTVVFAYVRDEEGLLSIG